MNGLEWIAQTPTLRVRQEVEWGEVLTGFQVRNRYAIEDGGEQVKMRAVEVSRGVAGFFNRQIFEANRPFLIQLVDNFGNAVVEVERPWRFFFSVAQVRDGRGNAIGVVRERWAWFARRYTIEDGFGRELAELHGPFFRPWTFKVRVRGATSGFIRKKWVGLTKESMTTADTFQLELGPALDARLRTLCVAATLLIDFVHFEHRR
ncbi:MAG TPA: phospholipid scramblase-related protein [Vulgatibacter sp.]|nr:phospholipid scramblase-related protein [Vulgatibacter sp.]